MPENISIFRKRTFLLRSFWKNCLRLYHRKNQCDPEKFSISNLFEKFFLSYAQKHQHFQEKNVFIKIILKKQNCFSVKIKIIEAEAFFSYFWKNVFHSFVQKYLHFEERDVILRSPWKNRFLPISPKISTFDEEAFRLFWNNFLLPYPQKHQQFQEKDVSLKSF